MGKDGFNYIIFGAESFGAMVSVAAVRLAANRLAQPAAFAGCGLWLFES